ncbi:hypothetical protein BKA83DRAFT_4120884 [Pisolithus microcarpus]|nr:hypothetical protein BKA83DRAFT_4120884 [Pisolithus microcarpus]
MGFPYDYYVAVENLQLGSWGFPMGVEILQVPQWDFSIPLMGGWGISNWAVRDSPWVWRFPKCHNVDSPSLLWGVGDSPIGQLWILHGVEIPQLPEWDFSITIMWQWRIPKCHSGISPILLWGDGDSPIGQLEILHGCGDSPSARMRFLHPSDGGWRFSKWAVVDSPWVWRFPKCHNVDSPPLLWGGMGILQLGSWTFAWVWRFPNCQNGISPHLLWGWGFSSWACLDSP